MSYAIKFDTERSIVNVIYTSHVSFPERIQAVDNVCNNYQHLKPLKILVDVQNLVMDLTFEEQEQFGIYLSSNEGLRDARVAVLHKPDFNVNVIVDTIAFANGYLLAQFSSAHEAEEWLMINTGYK